MKNIIYILNVRINLQIMCTCNGVRQRRRRGWCRGHRSARCATYGASRTSRAHRYWTRIGISTDVKEQLILQDVHVGVKINKCI